MTAPVGRPLQHNVRAAATLAPTRPDYAGGIRAAIATVTPLVVAHVTGLSGGTWMSVAGLNGALADRGGPLRARLLTFGVLAGASAAAVFLAALVGAHFALAVATTFVVAAACSYARALGVAAASVGNMVLLAFAISLSVPSAGLSDAAVRTGYVLGGALWAAFVLLVLWPIHPHRPLRAAVARCWREVGSYADDVAARAVPGTVAPGGDAWTQTPRAAAVRAALEDARTVLGATRRGRRAETGRGERLLVLQEIADQVFAHVIALADTVEAIPRSRRDPAAQTVLAESLATLAMTARALGERIEAERGAAPVPVPWSGDALRELLPPGDGGAAAEATRAHYAQAAAMLDRVAEYARAASATGTTLNSGRQGTPIEPMAAIDQPEPPPSPLLLLRASLSRDSVVLRHALRVGAVTAFAVWLTAALRLPHGYWVTLTAVVILQPYTGVTTQKAMQRVAGTVLGGVITAGLSAAFHDPRAVFALAFVLSATCVALLPVNYAAFSVFITPAFVLLVEASTGDWHLAGVRVTNTLIGGALAVAGARLLWPAPEVRRLPSYLAAALAALAAYLRAASALVAAPPGTHDDGRVRDARRGIGLAAVNAEESFQRLLGEHAGPAASLEPLMAFLTYTRRVSGAVSALVLARHAAAPPPPGALDPFVRGAAAVLEDLAAAVTEQRAPAPFPHLEAPTTVDPLFRARLFRLERLMKTLHDAAGRWITGAPSAPRPADTQTAEYPVV